jgi:molecular chaperone DnaJ
MEDLLEQMFGRARGRSRGASGGTGFRGYGGGFEGFEEAGTARPTRHASLELDFRSAALGGERELRFEDGRSLKVRIPPGVRDGETIRLPAEDLMLTLSVRPHPVFRRDGDDLRVTVPITVGEAVRGASVPVPTLGTPVKVVIPPATQTGRTLRVRGKGIARRGQPAGDLYVEVEVRVPEHLDEAVLDAVEAAYGADVRGDLLRRSAA